MLWKCLDPQNTNKTRSYRAFRPGSQSSFQKRRGRNRRILRFWPTSLVHTTNKYQRPCLKQGVNKNPHLWHPLTACADSQTHTDTQAHRDFLKGKSEERVHFSEASFSSTTTFKYLYRQIGSEWDIGALIKEQGAQDLFFAGDLVPLTILPLFRLEAASCCLPSKSLLGAISIFSRPGHVCLQTATILPLTRPTLGYQGTERSWKLEVRDRETKRICQIQ